jgi:hypothetical protein
MPGGRKASSACPRDERVWQAELRPKSSLGVAHLSAIALMVHSAEMKDSVQHQNSQFVERRMSELFGLRARAFHRYSQFAERIPGGVRWKREYIGRVIVIEKLPIQPPQFAVAGKQAAQTAPFPNRLRQFTKEPFQRSFLFCA